jgi:aspartate/glutamate racemase
MPANSSPIVPLFRQRTIGVIASPNPIDALDYSEIVYRELGRRNATLNVTWLFAHSFSGTAWHAESADVGPEIERRVDTAADALATTGPAEALMGASSLGVFSERVRNRLNVPVCDLRAVSARALQEFNLFPAGILGACSNVESDFWAEGMRESGGEAICPSESERTQITRLLRAECQIDLARAGLVRAVASLRQSGARSVILCTPGIRRILREEDSLLPLVCAAEQQIKAAVGRAFDAI